MQVLENMNSEDKTFFTPGTLVTLKHEELNSPIMLVKEKCTKTYKRGSDIITELVGIKTQWFDQNNVLREAVFSTKDLKFYK